MQTETVELSRLGRLIQIQALAAEAEGGQIQVVDADGDILAAFEVGSFSETANGFELDGVPLHTEGCKSGTHRIAGFIVTNADGAELWRGSNCVLDSPTITGGQRVTWDHLTLPF